MIDIQAIALQDAVSVRQVLDLGGSPRLLKIEGVDFRSAVEVFVNDYPVDVFIKESRGIIIAEAPDALGSDPVTSVLVLNASLTATERSIVRFRLVPAEVSGIVRLLQLFIKLLLTTPGTDLYSPDKGAGLQNMVAMAVSGARTNEATAQFTFMVNRVRDQITAMQAQATGIPADERLATAKVVSVDFDKTTSTLRGRIFLATVAGEQALANLAV